MANTFTKNLMKYFHLTYKNTSGQNKIIAPAKTDPFTNTVSTKPVKYTPNIEKMLQEYLNDVYETKDTVRDRLKRYNDLDAMTKNDGYIQQAVEMYTDEATQCDAQGNIIQITADSKLEKWISEFFDKIGIAENVIRDLAYNITLFADGFFVHDVNETGIVGVYPLSPYSVTDRLEFNPPAVSELLKKRNGSFYKLVQGNSILQHLSKAVESDKETFNVSDYFRSYLFGYVLQDGDMFLPPWSMTHFRRYSTQSEFFPFGRPLFINTLSPYKQYTAAKTIQAMLRQNAFPIKVWQIETGEFSNQSDKWHAVNQFKAEYQNLGDTQSQQEPVIASEVFMPKDQATLEVFDSRIDLNQIADIENLEQNMITSTGIPPSAILPGQGGFGNSGESMLRQDKKFARKVYTIQSAILEGLTELVHLQMVLTGDFDYETADFELSMFFPVVEEDSDRVRNYQDKLRLANDIIDNVGQAMGIQRGEPLPIDIVKQIFSKYSFIPAEDIDAWAKEVEKQRNSGIASEDTLQEKFKHLEKTLQSLDYNFFVEEFLLSKKRCNLKEGTLFNRHYFTGYQVSKDQKPYLSVLSKLKKSENKKVLKENISIKENTKLKFKKTT